jgi:hypothetical protein
MNPADRFYSERAAEAANSIVGTAEYRKLVGDVIRRTDALEATFTDAQKEMSCELWDAQCARDSLAYSAVYRTGLLDGIALTSFSKRKDSSPLPPARTAFLSRGA